MFKFIKSSTNKSNWYKHQGKEICFWGRSNVGKSSLLNSISSNKNLARVSKTPGRTQLLNYFIDEKEKVIVDLPGYGYAKVSKAQKESMLLMIEEYLRENKNLCMVILLIDSRQKITKIDNQILDFLKSIKNLPITLVYTKIDKLNAKEKLELNNEINQNKINDNNPVFLVSSKTKKGIDDLKEYIYNLY